MRKLLGKFGGGAILRPLLLAATLLLPFSSTHCRAQGCGVQPTVTNVSPTTWPAGQTTTVTITGTNLSQSGAWITEPNNAWTITMGDISVQTDTKLQFSVVVLASDPAETVTLYVSFADGGCAVPVPTSIQIVNNCTSPTITSITPNMWFAGKSYDNVVIKGTDFITKEKATDACPLTTVSATTPDGSAVTISNVNVESKTKITATVAPDVNTTTEQATVTASNGSTTGTYSEQPPAQVLGNEIHCDSSMGCSKDVISTTDGSDPTVQNVVVGQPINLTTNPNLPSTIKPYKTVWTVKGTVIKNYAPTTTSGSVVDLKGDDLAKNAVSFYWVYPTNNVPVTFRYCVNPQA